MTDNKHIEALENARYHLPAKYKAVIDDAIDIIRSQKAEIERLKEIEYMYNDLCK